MWGGGGKDVNRVCTHTVCLKPVTLPPPPLAAVSEVPGRTPPPLRVLPPWTPGRLRGSPRQEGCAEPAGNLQMGGVADAVKETPPPDTPPPPHNSLPQSHSSPNSSSNRTPPLNGQTPVPQNPASCLCPSLRLLPPWSGSSAPGCENVTLSNSFTVNTPPPRTPGPIVSTPQYRVKPLVCVVSLTVE